jgi:hypothetical protein
MVEPACFKVLIPYREPTYAMRSGGPRREPYLTILEVEAASEEEAIERAIVEFRERARQSSVSWVRKIQRDDIRVERLGPCG